MSIKLYVGGLSYLVTDGELEEIFSKYGSVLSSHVSSNKSSGKSRGFGFIEMATSEGAKRAIEALNGTTLEGRTLLVVTSGLYF